MRICRASWDPLDPQDEGIISGSHWRDQRVAEVDYDHSGSRIEPRCAGDWLLAGRLPNDFSIAARVKTRKL